MSNDRVLLDSVLADRKQRLAPELADDRFFELFAGEQLLREHDLTWDELASGIVGSGGDGGIDGFYTFLNGVLLSPGEDVPASGRSVEFDIVAFQAKRSPSFSEAAIDKLRASLSRLLDFNVQLDGLISTYNSDLLGAVSAFRDAYLRHASRFPRLTIRVSYISRGGDVHPNVAQKATALEANLRTMFPDATCAAEFVGARELVALARRDRPKTLDLRLIETITPSDIAYVGLASISDYFAFVTDDEDELRATIFESNVRDYEGRSGVNAAIATTLRHPDEDDFWWLNNGVTIVASRAAVVGKTLTLEFPQVVNGLQTTREIYSYVREGHAMDDNRMVLVRVVIPPSDASRDRIIRATNSQTNVPGVALYATDEIQRDIEDYFFRNNLFYERRRNRYRNEGKPLARIFTIPYLAEGLLAVSLRKPHLGAPRLGGRFLRISELYDAVFDPARPLDEYLKVALLTRKVEGLLRTRTKRLPHRGATGLRYMFPITMAIAVEQVDGGPVAEVDVDWVTPDDVDHWHDVVQQLDRTVTPRKRRKSDVVERQITWQLLREIARTST